MAHLTVTTNASVTIPVIRASDSAALQGGTGARRLGGRRQRPRGRGGEAERAQRYDHHNNRVSSLRGDLFRFLRPIVRGARRRRRPRQRYRPATRRRGGSGGRAAASRSPTTTGSLTPGRPLMVSTPIARGPARWRLQRRYSGNGARTTVVMAQRHGHRARAHSTSGRRPGINRTSVGGKGGVAPATQRWHGGDGDRALAAPSTSPIMGLNTVTGITLWHCVRQPGSWQATAAPARPDQRQGGAGARARAARHAPKPWAK